jgi:hypothetical protein
MSIATVIISAVSLVALFWILYIYSVRRARYLVRLELESFSENMAEEEQTIDVVGIYQPIDANRVSINTQAASAIKSHQVDQNVQIKPSVAAGVGR